MKIIVEAYPGFLKHCFAANLSLFYVKINNFNMYVKLCLHVFDIGEEPLQVARCTKIINAGQEDAKYMINVKQFARFVVDLGDQVAPSDIEEGMRVGSV